MAIIAESQWLVHYNRDKEQSQSLSAYAREQDLKIESFYSAIDRLRAKGLVEKAARRSRTTDAPFVKAKITPTYDASTQPMQVTVTLPSMLRVEISGSNSTELAHFINLLALSMDDHGTPRL